MSFACSTPDESHSWVFPILLEDEHYLALDKMTHMAVSHSPAFPDRPSLSNLIQHAIATQARWVTKRDIRHLGFAYRIDFETSGIALFCKNNEARQKIGDLLGANEEQREFHCLVHGTPGEESFEVDAKIGWVPGRPEIMQAGKQGKQARTRFEIVESDSPVSRCSSACRTPTGNNRFAPTCSMPGCHRWATPATADSCLCCQK